MSEVAALAKVSLPVGWVIVASKRYPRKIYYFNTNTGKSTWERPRLDPLEVVPKECHSVKDAVNLLKTSYKQQQLQKKSRSSSSLNIRRFKRLSLVSSNSSKHSNEHSSHSFSKDSLELYCPPTAVVAPLKTNAESLAKQMQPHAHDTLVNKSGIGESTDTLYIAENKRKKSENIGTSNKVQKKLLMDEVKKEKISPLNRTDFMLKGRLTEKNVKLSKKSADSPKKYLDQDISVISEKKSCTLPFADTLEVEDIEMLDVSMEILEDLAAIKETVVDTFASYYIVVDTNVLISELRLINELKDTPVDGCGPPHIFLPWIVIEELDRLKDNRNNKPNTTKAACDAVRYLNSVLGKHPRFHGQSPVEAEKWAKTYSRCNDDRLLECCMGLVDKMCREKVILLTNDRNLINKALICNINVQNSTSIMESVKPDEIVDFSSNKSKSTEKETKIESTKEAEEKMLQNKRNEYSREIHTVMCTARQLLKTVLAKFLEDEMHEAYGSNWVHFPIRRKLLDGILEGIIKYWRMVFSELMNESDRKNILSLHAKAIRPQGFLADKDECLGILSTIEEVFGKIKEIRPKLKVPLERIQEFRVACVDSFYTYCKIESTIKEEEKVATLAVFQKNWSTINHLCGMVLDFCGIDHDLQYEKPKEMPSEHEFRQLMSNLYPGVQQLKVLMFNNLESVRKHNLNKKSIKKFRDVLLKFIPSLEIPYEPTVYPHFTAGALETFYCCPENWEMIEIGYVQIEKFYSKLDVALKAIMSKSSGHNIYRNNTNQISTETMVCD